MNVPTGIVSHSRQVCSLYKRALRNVEAWYDHREIVRYRAVLLRKRFDDNRDVKDMAVAARLLEEGEKELFNTTHYQLVKKANSPGGCAYEREEVLDYWHPLEKAQYPEFFAKREERKKQYVQWWLQY
uniref:NADH dehydrogenase [ubiquinone] 1 beta subcomplex subunit 9 n=1 Tax=Glossina brevipalpis TaxID=37001 RepID=A0A1A9W2J6_9MUSC